MTFGPDRLVPFKAKYGCADQGWIVGRMNKDEDGELQCWHQVGQQPIFATLDEAKEAGKKWLLEWNCWGIGAVWRTDQHGIQRVFDLRNLAPPGFYNHGFGSF